MSDDRIPVLAITGGDVAGKSNLLAQLRANYGSKAVFVPEVASALYADCTNPNPDPDPTAPSEEKREWLANFQMRIAFGQLAFEAQAQIEAREAGKKLIVTDRGILDHWAFLHASQIPAFMQQTGLSLESAKARYSQVFYLESLAVSQPDLFTNLQSSNPDRRPRSVEETSELEKLTRAAWSQHERFQIIEGVRKEWSHFKSAKALIDSLLAG